MDAREDGSVVPQGVRHRPIASPAEGALEEKLVSCGDVPVDLGPVDLGPVSAEAHVPLPGKSQHDPQLHVEK